MSPYEGSTPWHSDEAGEQYDSLFPLLPDYVARYTFGGKLSPRIGLPDKNSLHLVDDILTVLIADRLEVSYATAKKRYPPSTPTESRWLGLTDRIDSIFAYGRTRFGYYVSFAKDRPEGLNSSQDLSVQYFYRTLAAFDASKRLSELGYLCEVAAILRTGLEQFAFSSVLWELPVSEELSRIKPLRCLNQFRKRVPASGKLYGLLSKYTHFEYEHHTHFIARSEKEILTLQRAPILRAYATHVLFLSMVCISKYVLRIAPEHFAKVPQAVRELHDFIEQVDAYSDNVCTILKSDEVLGRMDMLLQDLIRQ